MAPRDQFRDAVEGAGVMKATQPAATERARGVPTTCPARVVAPPTKTAVLTQMRGYRA
jgi:hypothetical protein